MTNVIPKNLENNHDTQTTFPWPLPAPSSPRPLVSRPRRRSRRTPKSRRSRRSSPRCRQRSSSSRKSQTQTKKTVDETQATADKTADVVAQEKRGAVASPATCATATNRSTCSTWTAIAIATASARASTPTSASMTRSPACSALRPAARIRVRATRRSPIRTRARISSSTWRTCTWAPNAEWKITAGKQRYAWQRTGSLFYDSDVNPEGIAVNYTTGNFFAGAFYDWLAERALSFSNVTTGTNTDSIMFGGAGRISHPVLRRDAADAGRHLLGFRWRAGLQPVLRWQLLRQHHDHQHRGLQSHAAGRASAYGLPAVRLRHHRRLRRPDARRSAAGRCACSSTTRRTRSRGESGGPREAGYRAAPRASRYGAASAVKGTWEFGVTVPADREGRVVRPAARFRLWRRQHRHRMATCFAAATPWRATGR